jgi:S1-C subfamily serine protease
MKKLWTTLPILAFTGFAAYVCGVLLREAAGEPFVHISQIAKEKTVRIDVESIETVFTIVPREGGFGVIVTTETVRGSGAGVLVSRDGGILSCKHLFYGDIRSITVTDYWGETSEIQTLTLHTRHDLAYLRSSLKPRSWARLIKPGKLLVGMEVIAVGHPYGFDYSVSRGIISGLTRDKYGYNLVQSDVAVNPGNSGGPLFDKKGRLVGIVIAFVSANHSWSGISLSISPDEIFKFLAEVTK